MKTAKTKTLGERPLDKVVSPDILKELEHKWLEDGWDAAKISQRYGYNVEQVEKWIRTKLVNKHKSRFERLAIIFDKLYEASEVAHSQYLEKPTMPSSVAYTSIVNSLRGAMTDLDNVQSGAELAGDIVKLALNPLIRKLTHILIEELGSFKEELMLKFPEEDATRMVNDVGKRCGNHFETALDEVQTRLEDILSARDKNRRKALNGGKKPARKEHHLKAVQ